jgi:hypothetical protein
MDYRWLVALAATSVVAILSSAVSLSLVVWL